MCVCPIPHTPLWYSLLSTLYYRETPKKRESSTPSSDLHNTQSRPRTNPPPTAPNYTATTRTPTTATPAPSPGIQALAGKTILKIIGEQNIKLPHPGPIFPHPSKPNQFTLMCCRSAYDGKQCPLNPCNFYHFPTNLSTVPTPTKAKLQSWVADQANITWSPASTAWGTATNPSPADGTPPLFIPTIRLLYPTTPSSLFAPPGPPHLALIRHPIQTNAHSAASDTISTKAIPFLPADPDPTSALPTDLVPEETTFPPRDSDYLRSVRPHIGDSLVVTSPNQPTLAARSSLPTSTLILRPTTSSTSLLENFARNTLPSSVQIQLNQPFGKDSLSQSFYSEKCFRHILLPVIKSGFISRRNLKNLERASFRTRQLQQLQKKYALVDFRPLQGFQPDWEQTSTIRDDWKAMTSACLLHFNGDVATVVRWIGGSHTSANLNPTVILDKLRPIVAPDVWSDLQRILTIGAPALCNASASEANFQAFLAYGNHTSVRDNQGIFADTIIKQSKRGLTLIMDPALVHFALNVHLSPQGLVDILHHRRKPRPLSDSSFRPWPGAYAINDWTSKCCNEPPLHFADSFHNFCTWHWNLAISYPSHDRHTGDDDVQCAFPRIKYNPNVVGMHSAISNHTLIMNTGLTFGDNTSPSNWEPVARARQQLAQHLWHHDDIIERARPYLPPVRFEAPASANERAQFAVAIADSRNQGVFDASGKRISPRYNHHVDDNMYGDISDLMERAASASIISLYEVIGYPDGRIPDPVSWDKFHSTYGHLRRVVGWTFNTRTLSFCLPDDKRTAIADLLATWINKTDFAILEAAELHGKLADASRANRKGRTMFFAFQNALRRSIYQRFNQIRGYFKRNNKVHFFRAQLPKHLHCRVDSMIARDMAALLWASKSRTPISVPVQYELRRLHTHMANFALPWEMCIGHTVQRDPQFTSIGDACLTGGGAYCDILEFWFDILWSDATRASLKSTHIHINVMEFIVVILQLAAVITITEEPCLYDPLRKSFPTGIPNLANLLIRTDNSPSQNWAHKASAKSEKGQLFVSVYADLLGRTSLAVTCNHIAGLPDNPSILKERLALLRDTNEHTPHPIRRLLHDGLSFWQSTGSSEFSPDLTRFPLHMQAQVRLTAKRQTSIGWENAAKGYLSKEWHGLAALHTFDPKRLESDLAAKRMKNLVKDLQAYTKHLWKSRNEILHSATNAEMDNIRSTTQSEIRHFYAHPDLIQCEDNYLFRLPLTHLLSSNRSTQDRWIHRVKASAKRKQKESNNQTLITQFFPPRQ